METYYLIDFENVHGAGLTGCSSLKSTEHIVIFFTQNARVIDMRDIANHGEAALEMIEVPAGRQSADMHIGSYLGYLAGKKGTDCAITIVSNDSDFDNVLQFWHEKAGITVLRTPQITVTATAETPISSTEKVIVQSIPKPSHSKLYQAVVEAVKFNTFSDITAQMTAEYTEAIYLKKPANMLTELHNALHAAFPSCYSELYNIVKPILNNYDGVTVKATAPSIPSGDVRTALNSKIIRIIRDAGFSTDIVSFVASTVVKSLSAPNRKQQAYRTLISKYGMEKGLKLYNLVKKTYDSL